MTDTSIITLRSATFGYAGRAVVSDATFDIHPGEVVAVLGPNGSGKSTLMRGLLGLNDHLSGKLELFGTSAEKLKERTRIGYVPQRHTLSASVKATVEEIVEVGRLPLRPWYRRATSEDATAVTQALQQVGLSERATSDVSALSGGQQRRVLIARALSARPDILIMDEPTAGVDVASQNVLADVLGSLAKQGVTMVIVTHEIEALTHIVTRVLEVNHGTITFDGTPPAYADRFSASLTNHAHAPGAHNAHHDDDEHHHARLGRGPLDADTARTQGDCRG